MSLKNNNICKVFVRAGTGIQTVSGGKTAVYRILSTGSERGLVKCVGYTYASLEIRYVQSYHSGYCSSLANKNTAV